MTRSYQSFAFAEGDSIEKRIEKLYMGITSCEEDLYCKGSAVAELNKEFNRIQIQVTAMRKELNEIKALGREDAGKEK